MEEKIKELEQEVKRRRVIAVREMQLQLKKIILVIGLKEKLKQ
jgi:hypothetical protein